MKIIVCGIGTIGDSLVRCLSDEGHDVAVIDEDETRIDEITDRYDVIGIVGNGACRKNLLRAGADKADVVIAMMDRDEENFVCCMKAKSSGAKFTVSRIRAPEYIEDFGYIKNVMGVDMAASPELDAAKKIARILSFPSATKADTLANGKVDLIDLTIGRAHPLCSVKLSELKEKISVNVLICAVCRRDKIIIPDGDFVIEEGDRITVTAPHAELVSLMKRLGLPVQSVRSVMIAGCDMTGYYLASILEKRGLNVKMVEKNKARCRAVSEALENVCVVHGDPTDSEVLSAEGIAGFGACISTTGSDEDNLVISMYARLSKVEKIIALISSPALTEVLSDMDIQSTVSTHNMAVSEMLKYIRGIESCVENIAEHDIKSLYQFAGGRAEALEFDVTGNFSMLGVPLSDSKFKLKKNVLIAAIVRGNEVILPRGSSSVEVGDCVIVVTSGETLFNFNDILADTHE